MQSGCINDLLPLHKNSKGMEHQDNHHTHGHAHGAHTHVHAPESINNIFIFCIALNILFVAIEAVVGLAENSLSLLSDAGHNLSDVFSLVLVLVAFRLSKVQSTKTFTYGLKKSTVLISLLNAIILLAAVGAITIESVHKFYEPAEVNGAAISWTAAAGIIINGLTVLLLMRGQKNDINVRGAFLHMVADTLVSAGVVVSGVAISMTGWNVIDPIVSIVIAIVILISTWRLLSESLKLSLDGTPEGIDIDKIEKMISERRNVKDVHHIHVWAISTTTNALTAHVVIGNINAMEDTKRDIKKTLTAAGIAHSTLEFETEANQCPTTRRYAYDAEIYDRELTHGNN